MTQRGVPIVHAVVALLVLGRGEASAAGLQEDFQRIADAHSSLSRYALRIDVYADGAGPVVHADVECFDRSRCIRKVGPLSVLTTPRWAIAADHSNRTLTVTRRQDVASVPSKSLPDPHDVLDRWLKTGARVADGGMAPEGRRWIFFPSDARQPRTEIHVDPTTYLLRQLTYISTGNDGKSRRTSIRYHWDDPDTLEATQFSESHYIEELGDSVRPASTYGRFRILRPNQP